MQVKQNRYKDYHLK